MRRARAHRGVAAAPTLAALAAAVLISGCPSQAASDAGSTFGCPGACTSGLVCKNGSCVPSHCGGVSGSGCATGQVCSDHNCSDLGCDPPCPTGQTCSAQTCIAAPPPSCQADTDCDTGESCIGGFCTQTGCAPACVSRDVCVDDLCIPTSGLTGCAPPYQPCQNDGGPYCANLLMDSTNCGACGTTCPTGDICNGLGVCAVTCIASESKCLGAAGSLCVNLQSDDVDCGQCGQACPAGQSCSAGVCAPTCAVPFATCGPATAIYCARSRIRSLELRRLRQDLRGRRQLPRWWLCRLVSRALHAVLIERRLCLHRFFVGSRQLRQLRQWLRSFERLLQRELRTVRGTGPALLPGKFVRWRRFLQARRLPG